MRPRLPASLAVVASFVTAIRREHKLLQIAYLPDPALSRATRVTLLAVLIFAALFANAFLVTLAPVETSKPPWHEDVLVPKMYFSALTTILINVFYLSFGALFAACAPPAHPVDHFLHLGDDAEELGESTKHRLALRREVVIATAHEAYVKRKAAREFRELEDSVVAGRVDAATRRGAGGLLAAPSREELRERDVAFAQKHRGLVAAARDGAADARAKRVHAERRVYVDDLRRREEDAAELHGASPSTTRSTR